MTVHTHTYLQVNNKLSRQNTKHEITLPARRHLLRCSFHHLWVFRTLCRSSELKHQTEQNRNRKPKKKKKIEWYNDEGDRVSLADQLVSWQRVVRPKSRTSIVRVTRVRRDFCFVELTIICDCVRTSAASISQPTATRSARARGPSYSSSSEIINLVRPFGGPSPLLLLVEVVVAWRSKLPLWPIEGGSTGVVVLLGD